MVDVVSPPDIKADLKLDETPHPEGYWEGRLDIIDGARLYNLRIMMALSFSATLFDGAGKMYFSGRDVMLGEIAITGDLDGNTATFSLWVDPGEPDARLRFDCVGEMDAARTRFDGRANCPCMAPDTCKCEGCDGPISLWRVDQPSS